jgi:ligand-binding SRPBCC domain-containing protein
MIVVQLKLIKQQLKVLGLPNRLNTLLVASQKGYITTKLFMKLIIKILIPSVIFRHAQFDLGNSHALLVVDGTTQHQSLDIINALESVNIGMHFLVPHSFHLMQPLDCLFFKCFKGEL